MLVCVIASIVPAVIFGEPRLVDGQHGGDPWRNILFDFQTLIGGGLAVFAAWWTVGAMEKADQAAQVRHNQIIEATVFREKRALLRAEHHMLAYTKVVRQICSRLTSDNIATIRSKGPRVLTTVYNNAITFVSRLKRGFAHEDWIQAAHLLEPEMIAISMEVETVCDQFLLFSPTQEERFAPDFSPTEDQFEWLVGNNSLLVVHLCEKLERAMEGWKIV